MVGSDSMETRMVGIIDKIHPYTTLLLLETYVLSLPFLFPYFLIVPSLLSIAIFKMLFILGHYN